jgi:hypothetical protein
MFLSCGGSGLPAEPFGHRPGHLSLVIRPGEHVIAAGKNGKRDHTWVGRFGQMRFGDRYDLILITVHNKHGERQGTGGRRQVVPIRIIEKILVERKLPPPAGKSHQAGMRQGILLGWGQKMHGARSTDAAGHPAKGRYGFHPPGDKQCNGSTQGVTGQADPGGAFGLHQRDGRLHLQDLFRPGGLFKLSLALPVAGKIESQGHEPLHAKFSANAPQDTRMPRTGETMPGNDGTDRRPLRLMQGAGENFPHMIVESDLLFHVFSRGGCWDHDHINKIHAMTVKVKSGNRDNG